MKTEIGFLINENDITGYIFYKYKSFIEMLNKLLKTNDSKFLGSEYSLPLYDSKRKIYGGGRVDLMFKSNDYLIPIELKKEVNDNAINQLIGYMELVKKLYNCNVKGIAIGIKTTKKVRRKTNEDIYILDLSLGEIY